MTTPQPTRLAGTGAGDPPPIVTTAVELEPAQEREPERGLRGARLLGLVRRSWPMWLVAFSLNGFFVYLGLLDLANIQPGTPLTAAYYVVLCAALLTAAWRRRAQLAQRLRRPRRLVVAFTAAAGLLVAWHSLNTLLLSDGELAYRLAGLLVLWSVPTALVAASFRLRDWHAVAQGLAALAGAYVVVVAAEFVLADDVVDRFSPINELDYISAAAVPALGAVAVLFAWPRYIALWLPAATVFVAATTVPGSRGPVLAVIVASLALAVYWRWRGLLVVAALVVGLTLGSLASSHLGTLEYLSPVDPGGGGGGTSEEQPTSTGAEEQPGEQEPITTISIRRQLLRTAVTDAPDRPLFGHGVGMLVDDTPEAHRMGVAGTRVYPHNSFAEAAYSLGAIGLVAFVVLFGTAAAALLRLLRSEPDPLVGLLLGLGALAFVGTNVSGAIGADALMWVVAATAVALYADRPRSDESGEDGHSVATPPPPQR